MTTFADLMKKKELSQSVAKPVESTEPVNPMAALKNTLAGLKKPQQTQAHSVLKETLANKPQQPVLVEAIKETVNITEVPLTDSNTQFQNPTMSDVSNYVFDEQPDESTQEITAKFDILLSDLTNAVGVDIPNLLAKNLQFIKEHPFLAEILKPESIGHLCNAMRKSYGYVVQAKAERTKKAGVRSEKEQSVLDSMASLTF